MSNLCFVLLQLELQYVCMYTSGFILSMCAIMIDQKHLVVIERTYIVMNSATLLNQTPYEAVPWPFKTLCGGSKTS